MSEAPSLFFQGTTLQTAWDSTSLGLLMECPKKYALTIIHGWRKVEESVHLKFGGIFASAMEEFFKAKAAGADFDEALDATVEFCLEATWEHYEEDESCSLAGRPWSPDNSPKKNRDTLLRTVIWYFDEYHDDPMQIITLPNGKPATELSFKFECGIRDPFGSEYLLCGHNDRIVEFGGDQFIMDQKTTGGGLGAFYFSHFDLDNQMSLYTYAGQVAYNLPIKGVVIDAAAVLVGQTTFGRSITMRSRGQLDEWLVNTRLYLGLAERFAESGEYPMNLKSCDNYGGCVFKGICSKDPSVRNNYLETAFEKRFWNPLVPR